jgi:hypothetical protein
MINILIEADYNDGDYVSKTSKISDEQLAAFMPLIEAIKNFKPYGKTETRWEHNHNWPDGDGEYNPRVDLGEKYPHEIYSQFPKELIDAFSRIVPSFEDSGVHTIAEIKIWPDVKETRLL